MRGLGFSNAFSFSIGAVSTPPNNNVHEDFEQTSTTNDKTNPTANGAIKEETTADDREQTNDKINPQPANGGQEISKPFTAYEDDVLNSKMEAMNLSNGQPDKQTT